MVIFSGNTYDQTDISDLHGRTAVVTGGTGGIGFEVAKALAQSRARVLLLSRKAENGEEALKKIKDSTSGAADIEFIECDLGNLKQVRSVGDTIRQKESRLDIFVGDAGVGVNKYGLSSDGIERHFSVNNLGHFLLINRLLPLIRKTAELKEFPAPRIIQLSSSLHMSAPWSTEFASIDEINDDSLGPNKLYARSKLAVILFTRFGLTNKVLTPSATGEKPRIYAIATHPGAVHTDQQDQFKEGYGKLFGTIMKTVTVPFMRSPEEGSYSTLWAATSDEVEKKDLQGVYVTDPGQWGGETSQAQNEELGENLWNLAHKLMREKAGEDTLLDWHSTEI